MPKTLPRVLEDFQRFLEKKGLAPSSQTIYLRCARRFYLERDLPRWAREAFGPPAAKATVIVARSVLQTWRQFLGQPPFSEAELPPIPRTAPTARDALSVEQLERLRSYAVALPGRAAELKQPRDTLVSVAGLLLLLSDTGLRIAEACGLRLSDVQQQGDIMVLRVLGKGNKYRSVPLSKRARRTVTAFSKGATGDGPLFAPVGGRALTPDQVRRVLRQSLPDDLRLTPHTLRHTLLTRLLEADVDLPTIQAIAGHTSITTTQTYLHPSMGRKHRALDKLE